MYVISNTLRKKVIARKAKSYAPNNVCDVSFILASKGLWETEDLTDEHRSVCEVRGNLGYVCLSQHRSKPSTNASFTGSDRFQLRCVMTHRVWSLHSQLTGPNKRFGISPFAL